MANIEKILKDIRPEFDFAKSSDFIEDGMLDSFDIVTLISEIEEMFNIVIDGMDIVPENFCSIDSIEKLIIKSGGIL